MVSSEVLDAIVYRKTGEVTTRCKNEIALKEYQARAWSVRADIYGRSARMKRNIPDMIEAVRCAQCSCNLAEGRPNLPSYKLQLAMYQEDLKSWTE